MNIHSNELESFMLKWTFITVFVGVCGLFVFKIAGLLMIYISGKNFILDFAKYFIGIGPDIFE